MAFLSFAKLESKSLNSRNNTVAEAPYRFALFRNAKNIKPTYELSGFVVLSDKYLLLGEKLIGSLPLPRIDDLFDNFKVRAVYSKMIKIRLSQLRFRDVIFPKDALEQVRTYGI
ncbi:hypothetical protein Tco_0832501 [Tanacetum coccineum]